MVGCNISSFIRSDLALLYNLPLIRGGVVLLSHLNFSQKRLIIHCNFADMFSILLLNDFRSLNKCEIFCLGLFRVFYSEFVSLAAKQQALIGETSNENQIRQTCCR